MSFKEALGELLQDTLDADIGVSFAEEDLKYLGVKAPKQKVKIMKIKAIRRQTKLDQNAFAVKLGVSPKSLKMWESGEKKPTGASYTLLSLLAKKPELVNYL